jgi:Domain of unknown function (DUF5666)
MKFFYHIIFILLITGLAACAYTPSTETLASGGEDEDIGIGGTGKQAVADNSSASGLGGTGIHTTGILGTVTGFGSIFVNGIEVEYDDNTVFSVDGKSTTPQQLAIGDVVEVLTKDENKYTHAKAINLRHEVIGKVESVDPETFSFNVNGQSVIQPINKASMPVVDSWVSVSGFRIDDNSIISTRVTAALPGQTLLRLSTALPFKGETSRWLIQAYAPGEKAIFELEDKVYTVPLAKPSKDGEYQLGIKIMKLHKAEDQLELDQVIDPSVIPRGRQRVSPYTPAGNNPFPGSSPGANQGTLPGNYIPGNSVPKAGSPGTIAPGQNLVLPPSVQNYRR